ncbi:MAG: hypothetical protein EHM24_11940 [Acidobacteria bacterium]|nr:MAG: hypothetical protein EHM24_11940 [Acidobacteriota bacterium]
MNAAAWSIRVLLVWLALAGTALAGQQGGGAGDGAGQPGQPGLAPGEVERLFDSYVVLQAQEALRLSDEQFPRFLPKLRALQGARRRGFQQRRQVVAELNRIVRAPRLNESRARAALDRIRELDARTHADLRKAYEELDQVLDLAQQARFRVFEEQVERRKLDLLMRARRGGIARQR